MTAPDCADQRGVPPVDERVEGRVVPLEALRGIAAIIVFFCHFVLAFLPHRHGQLGGAIAGGNLMETPLFFLFNGSAAVTFFFVLSGFVLSAAYLRDGDAARLARGAFKRWPRLMLLPLCSVLISYLLFRLGAYRYEEAAALSGSDWLRTLAYSGLPSGFQPDFVQAFLQGAFRTFFFGDASYNSNLWTMRVEFFGTFLAFGLAAVVQRAQPRVALALLFLALVLSHLQGVPFVPFVFGVGTAYFWVRRPQLGAPTLWGKTARIAVLALCLYVLGYLPPGTGVYAWMATDETALHAPLRFYLHSIASAGLIWLVLHAPRARRWLSMAWARRLGDWSFPLYVMQIPLLGSLSSWIFLALQPRLGAPAAIAACFALSFLALCLVSELFGRLDRRWCSMLGRIAARAVPAGAPRTATA